LSRSRIKPGTPIPFDGDRSKGRAFMNSCALYIRLCDSEFANDQERMLWVLSYMKTDRAAVFADRVIRAMSTNPSTCPYTNFDDFSAAFRAQFFPEDEATNAIMCLESEHYFQRKCSVQEYVDEFQQLVDFSGYREALAIVVKFRRGLDPAIQDKIAESGNDRPADDKIDAWYAAAKRFDRNRIANEAFRASAPRRSSAPPPPQASRTFVRPQLTPIPRVVLPPPSLPRPLPLGTPMEVDANHSKARLPVNGCFRCGNPSHQVRECPKRFDVRFMTSDEREDLIQSMLAEKDAEGTLEMAKEGIQEDGEGFQTDDG
jgi:hypothetical protein